MAVIGHQEVPDRISVSLPMGSWLGIEDAIRERMEVVHETIKNAPNPSSAAMRSYELIKLQESLEAIRNALPND